MKIFLLLCKLPFTGKKLPDNLATILDSASSGAVYVSFGATVKPSLMPTEKLEVFLQAFHEIKVSHV